MSARIGSLCSGYGGLDHAVQEVLGGELAWVADNDPGACKILAHRFPSVKNLGDITKADWAAVEPVDILTAGFPCQDVSAAGARAGLRKGTRSGVWLQIIGAIDTLRPGLVVVENVRGLLTARGDDPTPEHLAAEAAEFAAMRLLQWLDRETNLATFKGDHRRVKQCAARTARVMGLRKRALARCQWHERRLVRAIGTVLGSLASLGYDAQWVTVSASDAGAPHRRERVFIVARPAADASGDQPERGRGAGLLAGPPGNAEGPGRERERDGDAARGGREDAADAEGNGWHQGRPEPARLIRGSDAAECGYGLAQDTDRAASRERREPAPEQAPGGRPRADPSGPGGARADRQSLAAGVGSKGLAVREVEPDGPERPAAERGSGEPAADAYSPDAGPQPGGSGTAAPPRPGDGPRRGCEPGPGVSGSAPADALVSGRGAEPGQQRGLRPAEREPGDCAGGPPAADAALRGRDGGVQHAVEPGQAGAGGASARDLGGGGLPDAERVEWGSYGPAIARWEAVLGRPAPRPTEPGRTGERLSPRFVEWMMGLPAGWVTGVPDLSRNQQLHALGNGVVSQQAAMALRLLLGASLSAGEAGRNDDSLEGSRERAAARPGMGRSTLDQALRRHGEAS